MTHPVLLVVGSLHLDVIVRAPRLPRLDETVPGEGVVQAFGGKGGNQAVMAARMGARVEMAGAVGSDGFAAPLLAALDAGGVGRGQVVQVAGPSGMSVAILDPAGSYGAVIVSGANLTLDAGRIGFPPACGMLMLQNEIPAEVNRALAVRARAAGIRVVLNAAPARVLSPDLLQALDLLVVNRVEAADLTGLREDSLEPEEAAWRLAEMGPRAVIVTLGAEGLAGQAGGREFRQAGRPVRVISTHGAGDAFLGALAAEWLRGAALEEAARFGQAAAALHVSTEPELRAGLTWDKVRRALAG